MSVTAAVDCSMRTFRLRMDARPMSVSCQGGGSLPFVLVMALVVTHTLGSLAACAFPGVDPGLRSAVDAGSARVIIELRLDTPFVPEGRLRDTAAVAAQRRAIEEAQNRLLSALHGTRFSLTHRYKTSPFVALAIGPDALAVLERRHDLVRRVTEDIAVPPSMLPRPPVLPTE